MIPRIGGVGSVVSEWSDLDKILFTSSPFREKESETVVIVVDVVSSLAMAVRRRVREDEGWRLTWAGSQRCVPGS